MFDSNKILRSACRRKILKALSKKIELSIMNLVRITNSTYNEVNRNLSILEREEVLIQYYLGHRRIIQLNLENEKTAFLLKGIEFFDGL